MLKSYTGIKSFFYWAGLAAVILISTVSTGCSSERAEQPPWLARWTYDSDKVDRAIADRIIEIADKNGMAVYYWKTDEYLRSPSPDKLSPEHFSTVQRLANYAEQTAFEKFLQQAAFRLCPAAETRRLSKMMEDSGGVIGYNIHIWELDKDLYLSIADGGGTSGERSYDFWVIKNEKALSVGEFTSPPDRGQVEKIMIGLAETERIK